MPTLARRLREAVQKTNLAPDFDPFFAFVNDGVATWIHDGVEHSFDVTSSPTHAEVQRVVREALSDLHGAARDPAAPPVAHRLDRLAPTRLAAASDDASVEERDRRIEELERRLTDAGAYELCKARLLFLESPQFDAFRHLGHCWGCGRWFLEGHGAERHCSTKCKRRRPEKRR